MDAAKEWPVVLNCPASDSVATGGARRKGLWEVGNRWLQTSRGSAIDFTKPSARLQSARLPQSRHAQPVQLRRENPTETTNEKANSVACGEVAPLRLARAKVAMHISPRLWPPKGQSLQRACIESGLFKGAWDVMP